MMKTFDFRLGATGRFPRGKAAPDDEGELSLLLASDVTAGVVRIEFGKPITWLALPPAQARQLAVLLLEHATALEQRGSS